MVNRTRVSFSSSLCASCYAYPFVGPSVLVDRLVRFARFTNGRTVIRSAAAALLHHNPAPVSAFATAPDVRASSRSSHANASRSQKSACPPPSRPILFSNISHIYLSLFIYIQHTNTHTHVNHVLSRDPLSSQTRRRRPCLSYRCRRAEAFEHHTRQRSRGWSFSP